MSTSTNDVSRVVRTLTATAGIAVAAATLVAVVVTWRTSAEPVTVEATYAVAGRLSPDSPVECRSFDPGPDLDPFTDCVVEQPRSAVFPDADAVFVLREDEAGYNGIEIESFPQIQGLLAVEPGERALKFEPAATAAHPETGELWSAVNVGFPSSDSVNTYATDWASFGWLYGDITTREPFRTLVENRDTFGFTGSITVDPDDGATTSARTDTQDQSIVVTFQDVPIEWVPVDIADFPALPTEPPRSVSLLTIWGSAAALLALGGVVGGFVAQVTVPVARSKEDGERRISQLAFGFAHDLRSPIRAVSSAGERLSRNVEEGSREEALTKQISEGVTEFRATLDRYAEITGGAESDQEGGQDG